MAALRIATAVEGIVDEAVVVKVLEHLGHTCAAVYGKRGKPWLRNKAPAYNNAARHAPWFVLVDLDSDESCAPLLVRKWIPTPAAHLCFRVAVREVETWLIADREGLAAFLGVANARIPRDVESLRDPKQEMVNLASSSRRREIREDMVPRAGSGRIVGPAYSSRLIEFVTAHWNPAMAATNSDSLGRALRGLARLEEGFATN